MKVGDLIMLRDKRVIEDGQWILDADIDWKGPMLIVEKTNKYWIVPGESCWVLLFGGKKKVIPESTFSSGHVQIVILDHETL